MPDGPHLHLDVDVATVRTMRETLAQSSGERNTGKLALELRAEGSNSELKEDRDDHGA